MGLAAVILAAGKGTRMKSNLPKVLHTVCGVSMLLHVLEAVSKAGAERVVVVAGFGRDLVAQEVQGKAEVVYQQEQLGTAHALLQARCLLDGYKGDIMVLCGDTPLITGNTLQKLVEKHISYHAAATVLTANLEDPTGYGRVIRQEDNKDIVSKIVEQKDALPEQLKIQEINTGIYCFKQNNLFEALADIGANNAQGEYYLTDIVEHYTKSGKIVHAVQEASMMEVMGINDRCQLAKADAMMRQQIIDAHMMAGVTVVDPSSTYIEKDVSIGVDTVIYPNTLITTGSVIGEKCILGPGAHLNQVQLGKEVSVKYSLIEDSYLADGCIVGPYAYIRPGCQLAQHVKVGDFVELKKTLIGEGSKVPHLSYVGDAVLGKGVNIGAGTITCNYDGKDKWPTIIEDKAFIGSNTNLVAPVTVGADAITGAGSTITKDIPPGALGLTREKQRMIENWKKSRMNQSTKDEQSTKK